MYNIRKIVFIVIIILLVGSSTVSGYYWSRLDTAREQLADSEIQLDDTLEELRDAQIQLDDTLGELVDAQARFYDAQTEMVDTYLQLSATEARLVDSEEQLSLAKTQLDIVSNRLDMTETQLDVEKNNNNQMLDQYAGFKRQIANGIGATNQDRQGFITPENYLVSEKAQEITGGYSEDINEYWRDVYRLYQWVVNNISYSYDSSMPVLPEVMSGELIWHGEYWRLPEETLEEKTGDCEDMATLPVSLMRSYNEGIFAVWAVTISSGIPGNIGHVGAAFPVADAKLTIVDPTGNYYTGYGSLEAKSSSIAVNQWLAHWESDIPEAFISGVFTDDFYYEFSNTDEFLAWVMDR